MRRNNLRGQKFGLLTAIEPTDQRAKDRCIIWRCKCDCGKEAFVSSHLLTIKAIRSCGCLQAASSRNKLVNAQKVNMIDGTNIGLIKSSKKTRVDNSSGVTGIRWSKRYKKWVASIFFQRINHYLGMYKNFDDAVAARKAGEAKYFEEYLKEHNKESSE